MTTLFRPLLLSAAVLAAGPALAHTGPGAHEGAFAAGFAHPFGGLDHLVAMLAVGLWAALRGGAAVLLWPAAFVLALLAGFALALSGAHLPLHEPMILASLVGLGLAIALALRMPAGLAVAAIALFGLFHGFAHGLETAGADASGFAAGFALASALLHAAGIGLGVLIARAPTGATRVAGGAVAACGLILALV